MSRTSGFSFKALVFAAALLPAGANAGFISNETGDANASTYYSSQAFSGFDQEGGNPDSFAIGNGNFFSSNIGFSPSLVIDNSTSSKNGATMYVNAYTVSSGYFAARNYTNITVTNAQTNDGYYAVAGSGSRTSIRFSTPAALAARAVYRWNVTGVESSPIGVATSRLDFIARQGVVGSWYDLFTDNVQSYGPGLYEYSIAGGDYTQAFDLLYWSSTYAQVNVGEAPQGGTFTSTANYASTYELLGIDLYDAADTLLTDWTLSDAATGETLFDAAGRINAIEAGPDVPPNEPTDVPPTAVPEPGTLTLLALSLMGLALQPRRRVKA